MARRWRRTVHPRAGIDPDVEGLVRRHPGSRRLRLARRRRTGSASCSACTTTWLCCAPRWSVRGRRAAVGTRCTRSWRWFDRHQAQVEATARPLGMRLFAEKASRIGTRYEKYWAAWLEELQSRAAAVPCRRAKGRVYVREARLRQLSWKRPFESAMSLNISRDVLDLRARWYASTFRQPDAQRTGSCAAHDASDFMRAQADHSAARTGDGTATCGRILS